LYVIVGGQKATEWLTGKRQRGEQTVGWGKSDNGETVLTWPRLPSMEVVRSGLMKIYLTFRASRLVYGLGCERTGMNRGIVLKLSLWLKP
jgi:hypothetical protein